MTTLSQNFKAGDLLYGLTKVRERTIFRLELQKIAGDKAVTADRYNNTVIPSLLDHNDQFNEKRPATRQFIEWLNNPAASLADVNLNHYNRIALKQHFHAIANVPYQKLSVTNNNFPANEKFGKAGDYERRFRRACKARLLDPSLTIHFLLDGIDATHLFDRTYSLQNSSDLSLKDDLVCGYDTYTSAEIRFVLKHFEEIKDHVKFYQRDTEVNLFDWIAMQSPTTKQALQSWAHVRHQSGKLHADTLSRIGEAIRPEDKPTASFVSPTHTRTASSLQVPPTPRAPRAQSRRYQQVQHKIDPVCTTSTSMLLMGSLQPSTPIETAPRALIPPPTPMGSRARSRRDQQDQKRAPLFTLVAPPTIQTTVPLNHVVAVPMSATPSTPPPHTP